jgi:hypothetical protein
VATGGSAGRIGMRSLVGQAHQLAGDRLPAPQPLDGGPATSSQQGPVLGSQTEQLVEPPTQVGGVGALEGNQVQVRREEPLDTGGHLGKPAVPGDQRAAPSRGRLGGHHPERLREH